MSTSPDIGSGRGTGSGIADKVYSGIVTASTYVTYAAILSMLLLMCAEVIMRYVAGSPLGWNISLIEKVILPALVFLGLPCTYASGAHVTADMIYTRLPAPMRALCRALTVVLLAACAVMLAVAGARIALDAFEMGSIPPPLSSQLPIPTWIWRAFLPLGAASMLVLILIDASRLARPVEGRTS